MKKCDCPACGKKLSLNCDEVIKQERLRGGYYLMATCEECGSTRTVAYELEDGSREDKLEIVEVV